jgi:hypothetical protein
MELNADHRRVDQVTRHTPDVLICVLRYHTDRDDPVGSAFAGPLSDPVNDQAAMGVGHSRDVLCKFSLLGIAARILVCTNGQRQRALPIKVFALREPNLAGLLNYVEVERAAFDSERQVKGCQ